jgi:hypothetical protein
LDNFGTGLAVRMHSYAFDNIRTDGSGATYTRDYVRGREAQLHNVKIEDGRAIFKGDSYIHLPIGSLGVVSAFSIEAWVTVDETSPDGAPLFSYSAEENCFPDVLTTPGSYYIAVVFNAYDDLDTNFAEYGDDHYYEVYINGVYSRTGEVLRSCLLDRNQLNDDLNFVGKATNAFDFGFVGSIDEFRIWSGMLQAGTILSNFFSGSNPSAVYIPSYYSRCDVEVNYLASTQQDVEIGLFGGTTGGGVKMFGPETAFEVASVDEQCGYRLEVTMPEDGRYSKHRIAAMNYSVTLTRSVPEAPSFDTTSPLFCDTSKVPYDYLEDAKQLQQNLTIVEAVETPNVITFVYLSGICVEVIGSEHFSFTSGDSSVHEGMSCFPADTTVLVEDEPYDLTIRLLELYPPSPSWAGSGYNINPIEEYTVLNGIVGVADGASRRNDAYVYNSSTGFSYQIDPGDPLTTAPFSFYFEVVGARHGPDGIASVQQPWYIPVTGTVAKDQPNMYPLTSDVDLIYMVLRDPPGGGSSSTIHAG